MKVIDAPNYQCVECLVVYETSLSRDHSVITFTHPDETITGLKCASAATFGRPISDFIVVI